ncbi:MAG: AraC family transcriptional regulator [Gammaproteobacteria bacterium]|nr:AraC family transcriptional regulator [Gammaproteobacteria bacterium]
MKNSITVSSRALLNFVLLAERADIPRKELCALVDVDPEVFNDPEARVPYDVYPVIHRAVARRAGNELFWLHSPTADLFPANNLFFYMVFSSNTVADALDLSKKYYRLLTDTFYPSLDVRDSEMAIRLNLCIPEEKFTDYNLDFFLAAHRIIAELWGGVAFSVRGVNLTSRFSHRKTDYENFFNCPVKTDQSYNELLFDRACVDIPNQLRPYDSDLEKVLVRQVRKNYEAKFPQLGFDEKFRLALQDSMQRGAPTLDSVASHLAMSPRTLQRKLNDLNSSFSQQLQIVRKQLAKEYLDNKRLSLLEIAYLLGFKDAGTLSSAFRKWYGMTPSAYRKG